MEKSQTRQYFLYIVITKNENVKEKYSKAWKKQKQSKNTQSIAEASILKAKETPLEILR